MKTNVDEHVTEGWNVNFIYTSQKNPQVHADATWERIMKPAIQLKQTKDSSILPKSNRKLADTATQNTVATDKDLTQI
jgi:hypothetical protein